MQILRRIKHVCYHTLRGIFCNLPVSGRNCGLITIVLTLLILPALAGTIGLLINLLVLLPVFIWGSYRRSLDDPPDDAQP
jgi:hypothetical protein